MTDVLKIARDRWSELNQEFERLDGFIRMADSLLRQVQSRVEPRAEQQDRGEADEAERECAVPHEVQGGAAARKDAQGADGAQDVAGTAAPGVTRLNLLRRSPAMING